MRIVCQQTILMKYHALFVIFEKSGKILNCRLLQIIGGFLWIKNLLLTLNKDMIYWSKVLTGHVCFYQFFWKL